MLLKQNATNLLQHWAGPCRFQSADCTRVHNTFLMSESVPVLPHVESITSTPCFPCVVRGRAEVLMHRRSMRAQPSGPPRSRSVGTKRSCAKNSGQLRVRGRAVAGRRLALQDLRSEARVLRGRDGSVAVPVASTLG